MLPIFKEKWRLKVKQKVLLGTLDDKASHRLEFTIISGPSHVHCSRKSWRPSNPRNTNLHWFTVRKANNRSPSSLSIRLNTCDNPPYFASAGDGLKWAVKDPHGCATLVVCSSCYHHMLLHNPQYACLLGLYFFVHDTERIGNAVECCRHKMAQPPFFPTLVYYSPVSLTKPPFVPSCNISKYVDIACVEIIMPVWTPNSKFDFNEHLQHTKTATSFLRSLSMPFVPKHLPPLRMFVSMVPGCNRNNLKSKKGSSFQHTPQQWETGA